ncbi:hypothetical protein [Methylobacterium durans]|uniref:hypothetical protein n=1 Tax=Methylobacterium durans TaxID=2202825 RepID=UPI00268A52DA
MRARAGTAADVRTLARDQWTVAGRYDALRPFHVVALGDPAGTELYVSAVTGAVVLDTGARERFWNWLGAVPHWLYPTPLRARPDLWRDVVLWVSGIGIAGAVSGLVLGIWRLRPRRRYPSGAATPYRGIGRLHHLFGIVGGLGILTFVVSGWLSMNPNRWFSGPSVSPQARATYAGAPPLPACPRSGTPPHRAPCPSASSPSPDAPTSSPATPRVAGAQARRSRGRRFSRPHRA